MILIAAAVAVSRSCGDPAAKRARRADTAAVAVPAHSTLTGRCVGIIDGDTVDLLTPEHRLIRIRLEGIDAPERRQPFGSAAKDHLAAMIADRQIEVRTTGTDRYGRTLGEIFTGNVSVCLLMVRDGFAWRYVKYSSDRNLGAAEIEAQKARRGLWQDPKPVPPWEWRSSHFKSAP